MAVVAVIFAIGTRHYEYVEVQEGVAENEIAKNEGDALVNDR